jgi:glycosyltransferase involved in cell wall biosynthesis
MLRRRFAFDLVHCHYAAPAGDAARRAGVRVPLVVSAHGGDVLSVARESRRGRHAVTAALAAASIVLANSRGIENRCARLGAARTRVVHLGTEIPPANERGRPARDTSTIVTVAHLVERKRHADVLRAMWLLREAVPQLRWIVVGDGPERDGLHRLAKHLGLEARVEFRGALPHPQAVAAARAADVFVLPSRDEALGVAYVEAMAGGVPTVGCRGEPGPEEIAALGGGMTLVPRGSPERLATALVELLLNAGCRARRGAEAAETAARHFSWEQCGRETVSAYREALSR